MFIDTHCHLDLPPLYDDLEQALLRAGNAGVGRFIVPGVAPDGWGRIRSLAHADVRILPAFGIHPMLAKLGDDSALDALSSFLDGAAAVGEVGLDYSVPEPSRSVQQELLRSQCRLAVNRGLPLIIHCRGGFADLLGIMREERVDRVGGVMHAFSGSPEVARECIRLGFYISVCGTVTYANAVRPLKVVREIPLDRLLLETDAPDISPAPYRGRPNEPAYLLEIARRVAAIKGGALAEVAEVTTANAINAFKMTGFSKTLMETQHG